LRRSEASWAILEESEFRKAACVGSGAGCSAFHGVLERREPGPGSEDGRRRDERNLHLEQQTWCRKPELGVCRLVVRRKTYTVN
jgi:hypothetical protein